ncbi:Cell division protein SepF [Planktothrix agardhii]|uniref:Cell division protein SepF n=1 Tax=Planktothrix rubescens CCAP 1459/22 TaxID=329571 RepID=A0A6J7ZQB4_PLARU|nr:MULTISPECIES: cell division protein SepF [Planktothrix]CAH2571299.1 Cell division protein SepF [Planktothrix rubescens]MCF3574099.1 cell division protein SepF [Planktothrix agardhii 1812]MCF3581926.1 cell division protein SepF [Planktothrix agardhii 1811]CAC5344769.1 Cell division protein SepF [Planktothrix rubescens NIVA-CYA 18]CAD0220711.1 Cell division protein SepF [Planktothrix agardhii]
MNIFNRLKDFVGFNDSVDYDYEYDEAEGNRYQGNYPPPQEQPAPAVAAEDPRVSRRSQRSVGSINTGVMSEVGIGSTMSNVIGMPGALNGISEVVVMEPRTFEEMPTAIRALKERKSVVLNLTLMDPDQAQRAVDFVAGGTFALDGHQERIGESIFLFTPSCVQVRTPGAGVVHEGIPQARTPRTSNPVAPPWQPERTQAIQ